MPTCKDCISFSRCMDMYEAIGICVALDISRVCKHYKSTVDVAEVVRCKNCIRGFEKFIKGEKYIECQLYHHEDKRQYKDVMDYCSHGVRK